MQPIPDNIIKFLHANHVISIAAAADGEIWSAVHLNPQRRTMGYY